MSKKAQAPIQSKAQTAAGFKWGLDQMIKASKDKIDTPLKHRTGKVMTPRKGVWHPNASKP